MTIRITRVETDRAITLRVDGQLVGDDAEELLRVCEGLRELTTVDLGGLRFVDSRGTSVLRDLQTRGVTLRGGSPFVRLLLGQPATDDDSNRHEGRTFPGVAREAKDLGEIVRQSSGSQSEKA